MEMSEAAELFGVTPPSSRRDRKSGAKKRKQVDIERERLREAVNG
jgi:DNA (cytosine-5)-methyltransferase 1